MTFGDVDAMNERALESLDDLARIGTYEHTQRLTMKEPLDEPSSPMRVSDRDALRNAEQHEIQVNDKW